MSALDNIVADALRLSAIAAPTGQEEQRAQAFAALLGEVAGVEVRRGVAGNVLGRIAAREQRCGAETPAVVVMAHLDTVFGPEVDVQPRRAAHTPTGEPGETLYGPGIGDNAIALAALLALARDLGGRALARDILLAATVGEEGLGNLRGARALLKETPAASLIALEGQRLDRIVTRAVGSVRLGVTFTTPGGHSWEDRGAPSAVHALAHAVARVSVETPAALPDCAVNVGVLQGGTSINTIAARAALQLDLRAVSPASLALAETTARDIFGAVAGDSGADLRIEELGRRPAGALEDDHPLVVAAQRARAEVGLPPATLTDGSTDANAAWEAGIPGISIGITHGGGIHRLDEYIAVAPVVQGIAAALELIYWTATTTTPYGIVDV